MRDRRRRRRNRQVPTGREAIAAHRDTGARRPRRTDIVATGHGIELTGGELPYGTAAEALRTLVHGLGADVVARAAGPYADDLATICPPLGMPPNREVDRLRLLPGYAATLEVLAENRLVWLVIEDMHWVDASTRDLLSYLLRAAQPCQLLTLLTVRTPRPGRRQRNPSAVDALSGLHGCLPPHPVAPDPRRDPGSRAVADRSSRARTT